MRLLYLSAIGWFAADQLSKWIVVHVMNLREIGMIDVFPPYLTFRMGWNTGINFGLFADDASMLRWGLVALSFLVSAWVIWWARTSMTRRIAYISAGAIIGGAMGNAVDRVVYGAVADFLNTTCCGLNNPFAFNVADIGIFAGAFGLLIFADEKKITP
ncbi:MAG: signal peptidase II [Paracoccaceae bacterium]|jgi:signal peptidase II